ncbi:MAG: DNA/RNA helicase, partial [Myxococcales bacterium]|nr:DNA/RNA helicase [Myxococcales bacterium]
EGPTGAVQLKDGLPAPDLIIQDELHLITGPLGTMVGLYETAVEHHCKGPDGSGPKIIASTATARQAREQIRALYGRSTTEVFPPPGIDASDNFFAYEERDPTRSRLYLGVAAPGRSVKAVTVRLYSALLSAAYRQWYNATQAGRSGAANPADTYMSLLCYFNTLRELGGALRLIQEEVAPRSERLADRLPVNDFGKANALFANRRLSFDVLELTSRVSTDGIKKARDQLGEPYTSDLKNDVALASSMISVGVDISRLGLMVINGQPRTTAEYIQASSRVGRSTPGLVVTVHNPYRPRDRSHFERFTAFHEAFYRDVEASSVTPFSSRAIDRGLAGLTVGLVRHHYRRLARSGACLDIDSVPEAANEVAEVVAQRIREHADGTEDLAKIVAGRVVSLVSDWSKAVKSLHDAGVPVSYSPWEASGGRHLLRTAMESDDDEPRLNKFKAPTSMRDVE